MINLERRAGVPIFLTKDNTLLSRQIKLPRPDIRTLQQIKPVLFKKKTKVRKFYYMYRDIAPLKAFKRYGLRYDVTVIPHHKIGPEEAKTTGHYHAHVRKTHLSYPEVYQIVHGKAIFIFQKRTGSRIDDVIVTSAKAGDVILVPPNYGHIAVNPSKETLVMANFVYGGFKSLYKPIVEKHGGAYYVIEKNKKISFLINPNYRMVPKMRFVRPRMAGLKSPIYADCAKKPEKYLFLVKPQKYIGKMKF